MIEAIQEALGTLFTLFVVPSLYVLIARDHARDAASDPTPPALTPLTQSAQ